jgi:tRNA dimethylallyltransferase
MVTGITKTNPKILAIVGPTASGKSAVGVRLAKILKGEIISADSRQIYKDLTIGTAKPTETERAGIAHHLIDCYPLEKHFTAGQFGVEAGRIIDEINRRKNIPIVVGGSGLYIQALIDGFFDGPSAPNEIRERLNERLHKEGGAVLLEELRRIDHEITKRMNPKTTHRIVRALEVFECTGVPLSKHHFDQNRKPRYSAYLAGLVWDRALLYEKINSRVDRMIDGGLIDEVQQLIRRGYDESPNALQTVGYQEVFAFIRGDYSKSEMIRLIKRNTRRYAKRQMTWFRRDKRIRWYPVSDESEINTIAQSIADDFNVFNSK